MGIDLESAHREDKSTILIKGCFYLAAALIGGLAVIIAALISTGGVQLTASRAPTLPVGVIVPTNTMQPTYTPYPTFTPIAIAMPQTNSAPPTLRPTTPPTLVPLPIKAPTPVPVPTLPSGKLVSARSLAEDVGGDAQYWRQDGYLVWAYWNKDHNATFRHPGGNVTLTYWWGFSAPANAPSDCIIQQIDYNGPTRSVRCVTPGATFSADGIGLHIPP